MIEWRYERKMQVPLPLRAQFECFLGRHPAFFQCAFSSRQVNNIYLDSPALSACEANLAGDSARRKTRIRWYGELEGLVTAPMLELKIKQGLLGRKETLALPSFVFDHGFSARKLQDFLAGQHLPAPFKQALVGLRGVMVNHYRRSYYLSSNGHFRITLDEAIYSYRMDTFATSMLARRPCNHLVAEVKYDSIHDKEAASIINGFPFPVLRNSKYVSGMFSLRP